MVRDDRGLAIRQIGNLFRAGTFAGMGDGQLLEQFVAGRGEGAELAFAALVERHGPMVLRVCRRVLKDKDAAEDAFQATFLALVRGAGSVRKRDSVASWLHGAALRVSACARASGARRARHEGRWASTRSTSASVPQADDLGAVIHEEVGRLPANYRAAVLLCDLEGLSHDEAARHLGLPLGTVKSRVARGRERLRLGLVRRGFAPSAGAIGLTLAREAGAAVRPSLAKATVELAIGFAGGRGAAEMILSPVIWLARLDSRRILMRRLQTMIAGLSTVGVLTAGGALLAQQGRGTTPPAATIERQSQENPKSRTFVKTYAVADLLGIWVQDFTQKWEVKMNPLIQLISSTVAPGTWAIMNADGMPVQRQGADLDNRMGAIIPFPRSASLIIRHTAEVHTQVEERLSQLRLLMAVHDANQANATGVGYRPGILPSSTSATTSDDSAPTTPPPAGRTSDRLAPTPVSDNVDGPVQVSDVIPSADARPIALPAPASAPSVDPVPAALPQPALAPRPATPPGPALAPSPAAMPSPLPAPSAHASPAPRATPDPTLHPASADAFPVEKPDLPTPAMPVTPPPAREDETERRLRALEQKLDRILKSLDMPRSDRPAPAPPATAPSPG